MAANKKKRPISLSGLDLPTSSKRVKQPALNLPPLSPAPFRPRVSIVITAKRVVLPGGAVSKGPMRILIKDGIIASLTPTTIQPPSTPPRAGGSFSSLVLPPPAKPTAPPASSSSSSSSAALAAFPTTMPCVQLRADVVTPGFVDIHNHGMGGAEDVVDYWLYPKYTQQRLPTSGTTSFLASVVFSDNLENSQRVIASLKRRVGRLGRGAVLEGVHFEGPIVADLGAMPCSITPKDKEEKDSEAQPNPWNRDMTSQQLKSLLEYTGNALKVVTMSPSLESEREYERLKMLCKNGVRVALGHDRHCTEEQILGAIRAAAELHQRLHITHIFNVSSFHHRDVSLCNFGMVDKFPNMARYWGLTGFEPTVEVVADLKHVHPMTMAGLLRARQPAHIAVVTDAVADPTVPPGTTIAYNGRKMKIADDQRAAVLPESGKLSGSCGTLLRSLHNMVGVLHIPFPQAVCMLSEAPARVAGLTHVGAVAVGKRADLLLFTSADPNVDITRIGDSIGQWDDLDAEFPLLLTKTLVAGSVMYDIYEESSVGSSPRPSPRHVDAHHVSRIPSVKL